MTDKLRSNKTLQIIDAAAAGSYGVLAAIVYNIEQLTALIRAAEAKRSPLLVLLFPSTLTQLPSLVFAASAAAKSAAVPIAVHLDHAQDEVQIREVVETLPFDSIMVDMSHFEREQNIAKTRELTELCHASGIAVEAESGRINGGEDGIADTDELEALLTTPSEVEDFLEAGVDMLAPSVGNIHGDYGPDGPQLQLDRLESISKQLSGRGALVLHGTNDFSPELVKECIAMGVVKINVNKLLLEVWNVHLRENAHKLYLTKLMDEGMSLLQKEVERWMDIVGSSGKV